VKSEVVAASLAADDAAVLWAVEAYAGESSLVAEA